MKMYVAADYDRRPEAQEVAAALRGAGHEVICTWLDGEPEADADDVSEMEKPADTNIAADVDVGTNDGPLAWSARDIQDITKCDALVVLTAGRYTPDHAGHHFEAGYAFGRNKKVLVIGPAPTCFYVMFDRFDTVDDLVGWLERAYPPKPAKPERNLAQDARRQLSKFRVLE